MITALTNDEAKTLWHQNEVYGDGAERKLWSQEVTTTDYLRWLLWAEHACCVTVLSLDMDSADGLFREWAEQPTWEDAQTFFAGGDSAIGKLRRVPAAAPDLRA